MSQIYTPLDYNMLSKGLEITPFSVGIVFCLLMARFYAAYHWNVIEYNEEREVKEVGRLPPRYPSLIPYLGSIVSMLWDGPGFLRRVATHSGQLVSSRISFLPGFDVHIFQDRETVKEIWKKSGLMSAQQVHVYACNYMFGMPARSVQMFREDTSGPHPNPHPGSNIPPEKRIHRILNEATSTALTGKGLNPLLQRFRTAFLDQIREKGPQDKEWMEIPDLRKFIHGTMGHSLVESIFGPSILALNPTFMDDLFEFDASLPKMSRGWPYFLIPRAYKIRSRLHQHFKRWRDYARSHFTESSIYQDGDGDPYWGSNWMRQRQNALEKIPDEETLTAADLGVAWASIQNVSSASTLALTHISQTPDLVARIRQELESDFGEESLQDINLKDLSSNALFSSIYAETLRLNVKSFTIINSPHVDISLGRYLLPKGTIGLVNSDTSHMDSNFWNTKNGLHPVQSFWADRFLVDPAHKTGSATRAPQQTLADKSTKEERKDGKPYFSMEGLDGTWIPYGGGALTCPGRFLAKNVIIFACALLFKEYEIEVLTDRLEFSTGWYGFGTQVPKHAIQVRMRRRR